MRLSGLVCVEYLHIHIDYNLVHTLACMYWRRGLLPKKVNTMDVDAIVIFSRRFTSNHGIDYDERCVSAYY